MNSLQIGFIILALLMVLASVYVLLCPLLKTDDQAGDATDQASVALAILHEQFLDLEANSALGVRDKAVIDRHRAELERRVLDEGRTDRSAPDASPSRVWAGVVAVFVVSMSMVGYLGWGEPAALVPAQSQVTHADGDDDAIRQMVDGMAARLAQQSGSAPEWIMLARSYIVLEDYDMAVSSFNQVGDAALADADVLADWAEAVALQNNGVDAASEALAFKALGVDARHVKALLIAGTAAYEREDYAAAVEHWQKVLDQYPEDDMMVLRDTVAQARAQAGL